MTRPLLLAPSLMCADWLYLKRDLDLLEGGGADWWHLDVMDGHFVPNLTLGPDVCRAVEGASRLPVDIHLMVEPVEAFLPRFLGFIGARISFHLEAARDVGVAIGAIREAGCRPGLVLSPNRLVGELEPWVASVEYVCVMTVRPGFAGQKLIPECLDKIGEVRAMADRIRPELDVQVDGNVSWANIPEMVRRGANVLVAGTSSVFSREADLTANLERFRAMRQELVQGLA